MTPGLDALHDGLGQARAARAEEGERVADDLREELQEEGLLLSFEERMALALRLGERGLEIFRQATGLDREAAIRELQRQRQAGRTPSKCMSEIIG